MGNGINVERRNDIGTKVLISIVAILVTVIMSFSINLSSRVDVKANINTVAIKGLEIDQLNVKDDIKEIKEGVNAIRQAVAR